MFGRRKSIWTLSDSFFRVTQLVNLNILARRSLSLPQLRITTCLRRKIISSFTCGWAGCITLRSPIESMWKTIVIFFWDICGWSRAFLKHEKMEIDFSTATRLIVVDFHFALTLGNTYFRRTLLSWTNSKCFLDVLSWSYTQTHVQKVFEIADRNIVRKLKGLSSEWCRPGRARWIHNENS